MRHLLQFFSLLIVSAIFGSELQAGDDAAVFINEVQPVLAAKCVSCHGPDEQEGNLRLDSLAAAEQGGDRGAAVAPGDIEKSLLVTAISFDDPDLQMPPKQKLSDHEIAILTNWVKAGAAWPEPVAVLFEDQPDLLAALSSGNGQSRLVKDEAFTGSAALGMTPLQRDGVKIPGWSFRIRELPQPGEFRFLRLAWKKRGEGSVMIELAADGNWPDAKSAKGRYVAGPNTTGWAAISVREAAPREWTVETLDLWKDIGDFTLTGIAPTCDRGEEAFFDSIILGPTMASLDETCKERHDDLKTLLSKLESQKREPRRAMGATDSGSTAPATHVFNHCKDELMAGPWRWAQHGQSGQWVSELLPHTAKHIDELCQVRSMFSESSNHAPATYLMNTGAILSGKPCLGSWATYGLGSINQNLPGFVLLYKVGGLGGSANWSNAFLPAAFQGTQFRHEGSPVLNLQPPNELADVQRSTLDFAQALNRRHAAQRPGVLDLDGRIASYELAYRMQSAALDIGELSMETHETQTSYGLHDENKDKALFGRMCLLSRRLVEKGVRFVQLYNAVDKLGWDGHDNNTDYNTRNAAQTDQPIAALLADLKQRGMLDSTLVIWAGEFGRTPMMQGNNGRNHNPYGFTIWIAGGGVKAGSVIGSTDDIGLRAAEQPQPVKNLHATILTALGLNPDDLFFEHAGRQERLTGVAQSWKTIPGVFS